MNVSESFSRAAQYYDEHALLQREIAAQVAALCSGVPHTIVDLGAGTGFLTSHLVERFPEAAVTAIDLSPGMVEVGQKRCPRATWVCGDARVYTPGTAVDLVASSSSIQWMQPFPALFSHLLQILAPGGQLVFSAMVEGTLKRLRGVRVEVAPDKAPPLTLPTEQGLSEELTRAGFRLKSVIREVHPKSYPSVGALLSSLQLLGVNGSNRDDGSRLTRVEVERFVARYEELYAPQGGEVVEEFEVALFVCSAGHGYE